MEGKAEGFSWTKDGIEGEVEERFHSFLTSTLDGGKGSTSLSGHFSASKKSHGTHPIEVWVGPRTRMEVLKKRKISCFCRELNPGTSSPQPSPYTDFHFKKKLCAELSAVIFLLVTSNECKLSHVVATYVPPRPAPIPITAVTRHYPKSHKCRRLIIKACNKWATWIVHTAANFQGN